MSNKREWRMIIITVIYVIILAVLLFVVDTSQASEQPESCEGATEWRLDTAAHVEPFRNDMLVLFDPQTQEQFDQRVSRMAAHWSAYREIEPPECVAPAHGSYVAAMNFMLRSTALDDSRQANMAIYLAFYGFGWSDGWLENQFAEEIIQV